MRRKVAFQSVNINDGKVYSFDETMDPKLQGETVAASASIPIVFQPTDSIGDLQLVDGGIYSDLNLQDAINKCREVTDKDENIIVDVIMCNSDPVFIKNYTQWTYFNAWNIHQRAQEFKTFYNVLNDVLPMAEENPKVNFRYIVTATESLPGGAVPIFAKPSDLENTYKIGY